MALRNLTRCPTHSCCTGAWVTPRLLRQQTSSLLDFQRPPPSPLEQLALRMTHHCSKLTAVRGQRWKERIRSGCKNFLVCGPRARGKRAPPLSFFLFNPVTTSKQTLSLSFIMLPIYHHPSYSSAFPCNTQPQAFETDILIGSVTYLFVTSFFAFFSLMGCSGLTFTCASM